MNYVSSLLIGLLVLAGAVALSVGLLRWVLGIPAILAVLREIRDKLPERPVE